MIICLIFSDTSWINICTLIIEYLFLKIHLVLFPFAHSFSVLDVGRTRKTCADLLNDIKMKMALSSSEWTSSHLFYVSLTFMLFSCMTCHEWVVHF